MRARALAVALLALGTCGSCAAGVQAALPPIYHVYVIVLENQSASTTFGAHSPAPYLAQTLRAQGAYLPNYYGVGHQSNDNYIAMISGQAPNVATQSDCQTFSDFLGPSLGAYGQVGGIGCVYPAAVPTIASQLGAAGLIWRDYNEGMGADPKRETAVCGHPAVGSRDGTQSATATDQYATRHNPFVYFHSVIDDTTLCNTHVVGLDALPQDLADPDTPNFSFITPNLCNDGHDATCPNRGPGGLAAADSFLRTWVPRITRSVAYRRNGGLLVVTFDESGTSDSRACCGEIPGPGSPLPGVMGPGGGDVGAVLLSPYIRPGTVSQQPYNHYTLLRSVEDLFRLPHIGYAQLPNERSFGNDVFPCAPAAVPVATRGRLPAGSEFTGARIRGRGRRRVVALYSLGTARLRVTVRSAHRRPSARRLTLSPCRTFTVGLPAGRHGRVNVSATAGGGTQQATLRF